MLTPRKLFLVPVWAVPDRDPVIEADDESFVYVVKQTSRDHSARSSSRTLNDNCGAGLTVVGWWIAGIEDDMDRERPGEPGGEDGGE